MSETTVIAAEESGFQRKFAGAPGTSISLGSTNCIGVGCGRTCQKFAILRSAWGRPPSYLCGPWLWPIRTKDEGSQRESLGAWYT